MEEVLKQSSLARSLTTMFDQLVQVGISHVKLNELVPMSIKLKDTGVSDIHPYHTLLLLPGAVDDSLFSFFPSNNSNLKTFLQALSWKLRYLEIYLELSL